VTFFALSYMKYDNQYSDWLWAGWPRFNSCWR